MATTFKTFLNNDIASTKTLLHEAIPITGSLLSGTYGTNNTANEWPNEENIKNYSHGMFQTVFDYPYLSSSANHILDLTVGYSSRSPASASTSVQNSKKINIYNQMAQMLQGYDATGSILRFDEDGDTTGGGTKMDECVFINLARLLTKDEIKKGSFQLKLGTGSFIEPMGDGAGGLDGLVTINDAHAVNDYRVNSPAGGYAILTMSVGQTEQNPRNSRAGLIFYQAGIVVLSGSVFTNYLSGGLLAGGANNQSPAVRADENNSEQTFFHLMTGSVLSASCDAFRHRIYDMSFNNTTELNSTIHFCRANHNDFNYSANPTYLSGSKIRVKNNTLDSPVSYITTVGLYSADNELLAVAKLSEPLKKDPTNEMTIRVRLDY